MGVDLPKPKPSCWDVCWSCMIILEALERADKEDTEAADDVRELGAAAWLGLNDAERDELRRLSIYLREGRLRA